METVTFDTNVFPAGPLVEQAQTVGIDVAVISVTKREAEGSSISEEIEELQEVLEFTVWSEFAWGKARWGGPEEGEVFELALKILSNGSFPPSGKREALSTGQHRQLRDALILTTHVREKRGILVSNDRRAFVDHGRREVIQEKFGTQVMTVEEFEAYIDSRKPTAL